MPLHARAWYNNAKKFCSSIGFRPCTVQQGKVRGHLQLAHALLGQVLKPGDMVIDATAGNGHDSSFIAKIILTPDAGYLVCMDIQEKALAKTRENVRLALNSIYGEGGGECGDSAKDGRDRNNQQVDYMLRKRVRFELQNHRSFPSDILDSSVASVVYNLGYLPGSGDKSIKTCAADTIASINAATRLLKPGGLLSIMAYRGHDGGLEETAAVQNFLASLSCDDAWAVYSNHSLSKSSSSSSTLSPVLFALLKKR